MYCNNVSLLGNNLHASFSVSHTPSSNLVLASSCSSEVLRRTLVLRVSELVLPAGHALSCWFVQRRRTAS